MGGCREGEGWGVVGRGGGCRGGCREGWGGVVGGWSQGEKYSKCLEGRGFRLD